MIINEKLLRNRIRSLLLEMQVYPLQKMLADMRMLIDLDEEEIEEIESRLRSNWDRGYSKYSHVIMNDVKSGEPIDHILDAIDSFMPFYNRVGPRMTQQIGQGKLSSTDLRAFIESQTKDRLDKFRSDQRIRCRKQVPIREGQECEDFKVIHADGEWTIIYPKTILGSMSWAVGLADGSEEVYEVDADGRQIGRVGWCTAAYTNNMFPVYAGNLHMYYFIKNSGYKVSDDYRRLCVSWVKLDNGEVKIHYKGNATVNARNRSLSEKEMLSLISQNLVEKMRADAAPRKSTSLAEMASKMTLPMVKQTIENFKDDPVNLDNQLSLYAKYCKDLEVIEFLLDYNNEKYAHNIIYRNDLPLNLIIKLASSKSVVRRMAAAKRKNLPENILRDLAKDNHDSVRSSAAANPELSKIDNGNLIKTLAKDRSYDVRSAIAMRNDLNQIDKDLITQLSMDSNSVVVKNLLRNNREHITDDIIRRLSESSDESLRSEIASIKTIPEDILVKLSKDKSNLVRFTISTRQDLPKKIIIMLAADSDRRIKSIVSSKSNLPKEAIEIFLKSGEKDLIKSVLNYSKLPDDLEGFEEYRKIASQLANFKEARKEFILVKSSNDEDFNVAFFNLIDTLNKVKPYMHEDDLFEHISDIVFNPRFTRRHLESLNWTAKEIFDVFRIDLMSLDVLTVRELIQIYPHLEEVFTEEELEYEYRRDNVNESSNLLRSYINMLLS